MPKRICSSPFGADTINFRAKLRKKTATCLLLSIFLPHNVGTTRHFSPQRRRGRWIPRISRKCVPMAHWSQIKFVPSGRNKRPFVKKRMSPREETNVPSRRDENYKGAGNAYFPPTDEGDAPHEVGETDGLCRHVGSLAEGTTRRPKSAVRKKARLVGPCHKGIGRHCAEDGKGPAGVGFCSEGLARSKKSGTFVPSS